jgi:hypothetical protein
MGVRLTDEQALHTREKPLRRKNLDDFVGAYRADRRSDRVDAERWKSLGYEELVARDKANLDITWLRDESLESIDNLPSPDVIAREIVEDLTAALEEFEAVCLRARSWYQRLSRQLVNPMSSSATSGADLHTAENRFFCPRERASGLIRPVLDVLPRMLAICNTFRSFSGREKPAKRVAQHGWCG